MEWDNRGAGVVMVVDHEYIDAHSVAERYLRHKLAAEERALFETHLIDCPECADRLLLAEMFIEPPAPQVIEKLIPVIGPAPVKPAPRLPLRARVAMRLTPWQIFLLFATIALILVSIPAAGLVLFRFR